MCSGRELERMPVVRSHGTCHVKTLGHFLVENNQENNQVKKDKYQINKGITKVVVKASLFEGELRILLCN